MPLRGAAHERRGRSILLVFFHHVAPKRRVPTDGTGPFMIGGLPWPPAGIATMATPDALIAAQTKYWRLRRFELLDCLSDADVKELGLLCQVRVLERGAVIYDAGENSDLVFILERGAVRLSRVSEDGCEVNVGVLGPMEIFGELALAGEPVRVDCAAVLKDAVVCGFDQQAFERFLFAHSELALRITKLVGERLRRIESRIQDILFNDVRTRLAHTVARLANKFGQEAPEGRRIGLRLTQTDLAQLIGSTRETTSTIFNEFRRDGLLVSDGHYIIVRDLEALSGYQQGVKKLPGAPLRAPG